MPFVAAIMCLVCSEENGSKSSHCILLHASGANYCTVNIGPSPNIHSSSLFKVETNELIITMWQQIQNRWILGDKCMCIVDWKIKFYLTMNASLLALINNSDYTYLSAFLLETAMCLQIRQRIPWGVPFGHMLEHLFLSLEVQDYFSVTDWVR